VFHVRPTGCEETSPEEFVVPQDMWTGQCFGIGPRRVTTAPRFNVDMERAIVGLPPDFLSMLVALSNSMRLSLMKAAHAVLSDAA
jgi:hypothetical protein